ncbi:leucine-rich colipase-like protein 1 [Pteronotus mesoamericanus]|uniref:leucine-rich colipase-like protein 1 n=1 Tax=Pteronotus mesoamericanus TaxID=1884717 RepID=UPI0023ECE3A0|nr:leucine-rich colipase-like protein 1 [Pteronotus parnellii mesoamericanus]
MALAGRLRLLLLLLAARPEPSTLSYKGLGEPCGEHAECQSDCCATSSRGPQKFCTSRTVFLKCLSWQKSNGYSCLDHTQCRSKCCVTNSDSPLRFCTPRTLFSQCLPWRKPGRGYCSDHGECRSQCCLRLTEATPPRCVPRSGILAHCLPPPVSAGRPRGAGRHLGTGDGGAATAPGLGA